RVFHNISDLWVKGLTIRSGTREIAKRDRAELYFTQFHSIHRSMIVAENYMETNDVQFDLFVKLREDSFALSAWIPTSRELEVGATVLNCMNYRGYHDTA